MCAKACQPSEQLCPACAAEMLLWDEDQNAFSLLCAEDPTLHPGHQWASEREARERLEELAPVEG